MYWFRIQPLALELQRDAVPEREKMKYLLANQIMVQLSMAAMEWITIAVMCAVAAASVLLWYWANGGAQGQRLIERVICLSWPITVWLLCVCTPIVFAVAWSVEPEAEQTRLFELIGRVSGVIGALWLAFELHKLSSAVSAVTEANMTQAMPLSGPVTVPAANAIPADSAGDGADEAATHAHALSTAPVASGFIPQASGGSMGGLWWVFYVGSTRIAVRQPVYRMRAQVYVDEQRVANGGDEGSAQVLSFDHGGAAYAITLREEARAPGGIHRTSATLTRDQRVLQSITLRYSFQISRIGIAMVFATTAAAHIAFQLSWWWTALIGLGSLIAAFPLLTSLLCEVEIQSTTSVPRPAPRGAA